MAIVIDGTLGVSLVQDGIISESKLATGAVTDTKLTLTPNSQEIKDALNATGSAPIYACRAWVNFNGTGTVAIRASGNVTSITDNGTGNYTVNLTTAMPDSSFSAVGSAHASLGTAGTADVTFKPYAVTTSSVAVSITLNATQLDAENVNVAIFR